MMRSNISSVRSFMEHLWERSAMQTPTLRFPVVCPHCGNERLAELPVSDVADALIRHESIRLHAPCHHSCWTATSTQMEQLREYMAAVRMVEVASAPST